MNGFTFRGVHSSQYGIFVQDQGRTLLPPRREGRITIPARSGFYDGTSGKKVYAAREETLLCGFVRPPGKTVVEVCREVAYWLSGEGQFRHDREPDKYYTARLSGAPPLEQHLHYGRFTLTWLFNPPFAFGRMVTLPIASGETPIDYAGTAETPSLIVIKNVSKSTVRNVMITAIKRSGL